MEPRLVVILESEMRDQLFIPQVAKRVLELHQLDEEIMFRIESRRGHGTFEVKAEPLLDTQALQLRRALRQVQKQNQVEHDGRGENRVAAQKVDLDLHRIPKPAEDIDIVPTLFVITARRVIVNANLVREVAVQIWVEVRL